MGADEQVRRFKTDVAYARSAPFDNYQTYALRQVKVTDYPENFRPRIAQLEEGIRNVLARKGLREVKADSDILVQYVLGTRQVKLALEDIDNAVTANTSVHAEVSMQGMLSINIVDQNIGKPVWRVTASRKMVEGDISQAVIDEDCTELLSEFPPL